VKDLEIDKGTMLRLTAQREIEGEEHVFSILLCKKDGSLREIKKCGRFVKDGMPTSKTGKKSTINYNKTETILLYEISASKKDSPYITVPISAIIKYNRSWLKH
jgi:hypothetical protein